MEAEPRFLPWVGDRYFGGNRYGLRLLVLGESHYGDPTEHRDRDFTRWVVRHFGQERRARFFTRTAKVLIEDRDPGWISDAQRAEVWEHVAFYNFVLTVMEGPGHAPSNQHWEAAQAPFRTVLDVLFPQAVLILGRRVNDHVKQRPDGIHFRCISHPSWPSMRYRDAVPVFQELLRAARS